MDGSRADALGVLARLTALLLAPLALAPAAAGAAVVHPKPWSSSFETGDMSEWSYWGQAESSVWGHLAVLDPLLSGVPRDAGRLAARFETTPLDIATGHVQAKVSKWFDRPRRGSWDVSGRYCASYFFPRGYHAVPASADMVFEFKQEWVDGSGFHQDPMWWVEIDAAREWSLAASRPDAPVAVLYHLYPRPPVQPVVLPLGRWTTICARVRQKRSVTLEIDGATVQVGTARQYPVGPERKARRWILGVGNYSRAANGPLWVDAVSYRPG